MSKFLVLPGLFLTKMSLIGSLLEVQGDAQKVAEILRTGSVLLCLHEFQNV